MADDADREPADEVLGAERDERRRIALFLHDGPVQTLAGVALMLDASLDLIERGEVEQARDILGRALGRTRETFGELRDLSASLEPAALRDHGFAAAVDTLVQSRCAAHGIEAAVDVGSVDALDERRQAALYQIVREALEEAIRRGPPSRFAVSAATDENGVLSLVVRDDAPAEHRRRTFEVLEERARTVGGAVTLEHEAAGTTLKLELRD